MVRKLLFLIVITTAKHIQPDRLWYRQCCSCRTRYRNYYSQSKTTAAQTTVRITLDKCFTRNTAPVILSCALIFSPLLFLGSSLFSLSMPSSASGRRAMRRCSRRSRRFSQSTQPSSVMGSGRMATLLATSSLGTSLSSCTTVICVDKTRTRCL